MSAERPAWNKLERVQDEDEVVRLVDKNDVDLQAPAGSRVKRAAMRVDRMRLSPENYGASVFIPSLLQDGLKGLIAGQDGWSRKLVSVLTAAGYRTVFDCVRHSPMDCNLATVKHAHASLITEKTAKTELRKLRIAAIRLVEEGLQLDG